VSYLNFISFPTGEKKRGGGGGGGEKREKENKKKHQLKYQKRGRGGGGAVGGAGLGYRVLGARSRWGGRGSVLLSGANGRRPGNQQNVDDRNRSHLGAKTSPDNHAPPEKP